jgi:hypothetical protein
MIISGISSATNWNFVADIFRQTIRVAWNNLKKLLDFAASSLRQH